MSQRITDFFRRPSGPSSSSGQSQQRSINSRELCAVPSQPPPLSEVPSSLAENTSSRLRDTPSDSPGVQLNESLLHSVNNSPDEETSHQSFQSARTTGDSSVGAGFNSSQRVIRNGMEVVISSDGDETDSIASLEDVDELLKMFTNPKPKDNASEKPPNSSSTNTHTGLQSSHRMPLRTSPTKQNKFNPSDYTVPKYENTLDMLVAEAVDDNETEADVAKLKAAFEAEDSQNHGETKSDSRGGLHEDMLTSALGDKDDELGLQRLLDAVRRTEVFEQEKSWLFFDDKSNTPPIREFPREAVVPGAYLAGLREPDSRERMFHSGIIDFALSKDFLADELVTWIFHSVPSEPSHETRTAYCRAFKHVTAKRVSSLIRPEDVDCLFRQLGARPKALTLSEPVVPGTSNDKFSSESHINRSALVSVFELLRSGTDLFSNDTLSHILIILFRMAIDRSLTEDTIISSELDCTITALLESSLADSWEVLKNVNKTLYETVKDASFQSRLLTHILPTTDWIALLRCRLAVAFLTRTSSPLTEPPGAVLNLKRITSVLGDRRFDIKRHKNKATDGYDYGELISLTTLLNVAIQPGMFRDGFPSKAAECEFNADVDSLAERIKIIFTSIQGLGASHLKRILAKSALETVHYRILYSVRSRPPPKVSLLYEPDKDMHRMKEYYPVKQNSSGKQEHGDN